MYVRKKRHPILWALAILLVLGWAGSRMGGREQGGTGERSLPREAAPSPTSNFRATARPTVTPRPTAKPTLTPRPTPTPLPTPTSGETGVTPEFKAAMDSYEAFFDEYAALMKAVDENPGSTSLLLRYGEMLSRYTETMEKLDAIGKEELSAADSAYYVRTMARIEAKLLEVMQELE